MGRPLKIQKYNSSTSTPIDQAYPPFSSLIAPAVPTGTNPPWLGVVGGVQGGGVSTTYPVVRVQVNITNSTSGDTDGVILRQKGSHKYLVATAAGIDPANAVVGVALRILTVGDTNWQSMGAPAGAGIGTIFTPTAAAGSGTSGTAQEVGVCVLTSDLSPGAGLMAISYTTGDSTAVAISKLTNKFLLDWSNFQNAAGTSLTSYSGNDNVGVVNYTGEGQYLANFFTDEGTEAKSGSETDATLSLAIVENYTS